MKAATLHKQCFTGSGSTARASQPGRPVGLHHPRRHAVGMRRAPRLTDSAGPDVPAAPARSDEVIVHEGTPRILHVDGDAAAAEALGALLTPEATVVHVATLAEARRLLQSDLFSLVVLDPGLTDGDGAMLLPLLANTPLLVYAERQPHWPGQPGMYLAKPWTPPRVLFGTITRMLGLAPLVPAGD